MPPLAVVEQTQAQGWRWLRVDKQLRVEPELEPEPAPEPAPEPEPKLDSEPVGAAVTAAATDLRHAVADLRSVTADLCSATDGGHFQNCSSFHEGEPGLFTAEFCAVAAKMDPLLHRALVEDVVDSDDKALVRLLEIENGISLSQTGALLRRPSVIGPAGCAALRAAVDAERNVTRDSVDEQAQHQLNIRIGRLTELIGREDVKSVWRLADELLAMQQPEPSAAPCGYVVDMFVRRYTRETRPWIPFHHDTSNVTLNVALSPDGAHEGGRLHAILEGRHRAISRQEGEATVHGDDVVHGVSAMRSGVRYSLILFFFILEDDDEFTEFQTLPKAELEGS